MTQDKEVAEKELDECLSSVEAMLDQEKLGQQSTDPELKEQVSSLPAEKDQLNSELAKLRARQEKLEDWSKERACLRMEHSTLQSDHSMLKVKMDKVRRKNEELMQSIGYY